MGIAPGWGVCPRTATPDCTTWVSAMSAVSHVLRRGAAYDWRRKAPRARSLDALIEELSVMPDHGFLTPAKLYGMRREAVMTHLAKMERVNLCGVIPPFFVRSEIAGHEKAGAVDRSVGFLSDWRRAPRGRFARLYRFTNRRITPIGEAGALIFSWFWGIVATMGDGEGAS